MFRKRTYDSVTETIGVTPMIRIQTLLPSNHATCTSLAPGIHRGVKWPNDVQVAGRKIGGILVEVPNYRSRAVPRYVVGVGLNVNNSWRSAPDELRDVGIALCDCLPSPHERTDLLMQILTRLDRRLDQLARDDPSLPAAWQALCVLRGRNVELDVGKSQLCGYCDGIDKDGALLVQTAQGPERVVSGTVLSAGLATTR